jgi:hypothetical protein
MLAVLIVHFGSASVTMRAMAALRTELPDESAVFLVDNEQTGDSPNAVHLAATGFPDVRLTRNVSNLGFAAGMNVLLDQALSDPKIDTILLLNNDTIATRGFLGCMLSHLDPDRRVDMVAARLLDAEDGASIDSLGISLYRSGIASNRKSTQERLLGPTGGCMLLTRRLLEDIRSRHGAWFDESFFCYAEDTDLVMRARWLGYEAAYADAAVVHHHGSLSSGGADNEFVLYHGIRNSIWALAKNAPGFWLFVHLPWIVAAHAGIWLRNLRKGRWRTLFRLYWHALKGLPRVMRQRRMIRRTRRVSARQWWHWVEPRLYEPGFLKRAWQELFR